MNDIEARLQKLERVNRRMMRAGIGVLLLAGGAILLGQAAPDRITDEVRTRRLVVVDATGRVCADLGIGTVGPRLALRDLINFLLSTWPWAKFVVPLSVEFVWRQRDAAHLRLRDHDAGCVLSLV